MISEATLRNVSEDQISQPDNPWKSPTIPTTIDFTGNYSTQFPPLKSPNPPTSHPANDTRSDTTTVTTIQSAITTALAEHRAELEEMRATFQQEIAELKNQLTQRQIPAHTSLESKIDMLMTHFQLTTANPASDDERNPSPPRKKRDSHRQHTCTLPDTPTDMDATGWGFDDEDDLPSSQDGDMTPSGSEY